MSVNVCGCFGFDSFRFNGINGFNADDGFGDDDDDNDDDDVDSDGSRQWNTAQDVFARVFTSEVESVD